MEIYGMNKEEFINYDFTKDTFKNKDYLKLFDDDSNVKIFERYVMYRKNSKSKKIDPDNYSDLLKKIYFDYYFKDIKYKVIKCSDTMTSVQTLINNFYMKLIEEDDKLKNEWEEYKKAEKLTNRARFSEKAMIHMFNNISEYPEFKAKIVDCSKLINFIKRYHTIGNYIPVPEGFNQNRSCAGKYDMWDLTLIKIKNYYDGKLRTENEKSIITDSDKALNELLHIEEIVNSTKNWLDLFESWENFVNLNYLKAYVDEQYNINKSFTDQHNWKETKPKDYEKYFETLESTIKERAKNIFDGDNNVKC